LTEFLGFLWEIEWLLAFPRELWYWSDREREFKLFLSLIDRETGEANLDRRASLGLLGPFKILEKGGAFIKIEKEGSLGEREGAELLDGERDREEPWAEGWGWESLCSLDCKACIKCFVSCSKWGKLGGLVGMMGKYSGVKREREMGGYMYRELERGERR
jgi:hypothetical protein